MTLLDLIIKEFISIVESLEQNSPVENDRIILDRENFKQLLERYTYINFKQKCRAYKDLNFIIHDKNNYTMPYKDNGSKKTVRKVIINYHTYETIKSLIDKVV